MSQVKRQITRHYDVMVKNGDVRVESKHDGSCYICTRENSISGFWCRDDAHVRQIIEALQDYLIAKHELAAGDSK